MISYKTNSRITGSNSSLFEYYTELLHRYRLECAKYTYSQGNMQKRELSNLSQFNRFALIIVANDKAPPHRRRSLKAKGGAIRFTGGLILITSPTNLPPT